MFGLNYSQPKTVLDFKRAYANALKNKAPTILEVKSDRSENVLQHKNLQKILNAVKIPKKVR